MPAIAERRRHERKEIGGSAIVAGREVDLIDLSLSGFCVQDGEAVAVGRELPFEVHLRGGVRIHGSAQVRWSELLGRRRAHGLEIVRIGPVARQRLVKQMDPYHFGWLQLGRLALEFGCVAAAVLACRELVLQDPEMSRRVAEALPYLLAAAGLLLVPYLVLRRS